MDKLESLESAYKKENSRIAVMMLAVLVVPKYGKIALILDRESVHKSKRVQGFFSKQS